MARFNFNSIALSTRADASKINENFNKIESNAVLKTELATTSANGLMTSAMVTKLNGIANGANKTTVDSALSSTSTNPVQNKIIKAALENKVDKIEGKGLSTNDYTTNEKNKLASIEADANKTTIDNSLSTESNNPVANSAVTQALNGKVNVQAGKGLSTNDYTTEEKNKLADIDMSTKVNKSGDTMTGALTTTDLTVGSRTGSTSGSSLVAGYNCKANRNSTAIGFNTQATNSLTRFFCSRF